MLPYEVRIWNEPLCHRPLAFVILSHLRPLRSHVERLFLGIGDYFTAKKSNIPALLNLA